jgi:hypothetical protein
MNASIDLVLEKAQIAQTSYENSDLEKESENKKEKSENDDKEEKHLCQFQRHIFLALSYVIHKNCLSQFSQVFIGIIASPPEMKY